LKGPGGQMLTRGGKEATVMVLELDNKEKEALKNALEVIDGQLKDERVKTDDRELRDCLREDQYLLERILRKVSSTN
jgi:hypothetical protein